MIVIDNNLEVPHGNTVIWRYMSLDKFLDLIITDELFFSNAFSLTDRYEADIPIRNKELIRNKLLKKGLPENEVNEKLTNLNMEVVAQKLATLVNCWSINQTESYALWKIYLSGGKAGVAIKSTVGRLKKSINNIPNNKAEKIFIGKVSYTDFIDENNIDRKIIITTKSNYYKYENELRLFILYNYKEQIDNKVANGHRIKVDTNIMIEKVFLSPFTSSWFQNSFREVLSKIKPFLVNNLVKSGIYEI